MYLELFKQILSIVNRENDLNGNNIVEKIQKQLQRRESSTYEEWRKENFDINYKFSNNDCKELILLHVASLGNQENVVNVLLAVEGINVNLQDKNGKTPLHLAIKEGNENIVKALLAAQGIDVNSQQNLLQQAPLHLAIKGGNENIVKALLAVENINVNLQDKDRETPLCCAVEKGKIEIVEALLAKGPNDIDLPNKCGRTPLYIAAKKSHHKIVRALLKAGADSLVKGRCNKNLAEIVTEDVIMTAIILGVGIFVIASVVAAIVVTSAYFIGVSLSVGAMAGIAVAAAVLTGLVAGGIKYEVYKPCDELKDAIAQKTRVSSELGAAV